MSKLAELRLRIRAVENIERITRTLATVSAAKLSRARRRAAGLREYSAAFREILAGHRRQLVLLGGGSEADLMEPRDPVRTVAILLVTADRGMCGGYNIEACRIASGLWQEATAAGRAVRFVAIGRRGASFLARRRADVIHVAPWHRGGVGAEDVERLLAMLVTLYRERAADEVRAVFTEFRSAIHRRPRSIVLLPVRLEELVPADESVHWSYEPSAPETLEELVHIHLRVQLLGALLESYASEQGARMITMEEASERADRSLQGYRVQYNRMRREGITTDLLGTLFASTVGSEGGGAETLVGDG